MSMPGWLLAFSVSPAVVVSYLPLFCVYLPRHPCPGGGCCQDLILSDAWGPGRRAHCRAFSALSLRRTPLRQK
eukprot:6247051-Pyramimonas_sp.AAC.1